MFMSYIAMSRQRQLYSTFQQHCTQRCLHLNGFDVALHATSHSELGPAGEALGLILLVVAPGLIAGGLIPAALIPSQAAA